MDGDQQLIKGRREKDVKLNDFIMRINDVVLNEFLNKRGRDSLFSMQSCCCCCFLLESKPKRTKKAD